MGAPTFTIIRTADTDLSRVQDNIARAVNPVLTAVANTPIMGAAPPPWQVPTLQNGFTQTGVTFAIPAFHKDALGYVHGKGKAHSTAGAAASTTIYALPAGYRPNRERCFAQESWTGAAHAFASVHVTPDGRVFPSDAIAANGDIDVEFSFLAEQ
jgi:hypothetical protein